MLKSIFQIGFTILLVNLICFPIQASPDFNSFPIDSSKIKKEDRISFFDHLSAIGEIVEITLETDLSLLVENRNSANYQPGLFNYLDKNGEAISFEIQLRPRGRMRRRICDIPPVKLNFSKKDLKQKGIKKYDDFKLVSPCKSGSEGEKLLLREYLVYKLYNQMTPESFNVQLLKINFIDTSEGREAIVKYGFLIENEKELAERLQGEIYEKRGVKVADFDQENYQRVAMFNYMIGNTDWDTKKLHNVKLLKRKDQKGILVIPYDFDYSGIVDAEYARPSPDYGLLSVRERHYRGHRYDHPIFIPCQQKFIEKQMDFEKSLNEITCLNKSCKKYTKKYLKSFYRILKKKRLCKKHLKPDKILVFKK